MVTAMSSGFRAMLSPDALPIQNDQGFRKKREVNSSCLPYIKTGWYLAYPPETIVGFRRIGFVMLQMSLAEIHFEGAPLILQGAVLDIKPNVLSLRLPAIPPPT